MKKIILLIFAGLILSGCAKAPTREEFYKADFGPKPDNYEQLVKDYYFTKLFDPYSAQYTFAQPHKGWLRFGGGTYGWYVCGTVNSKNRFGAYVGARPFYFMIRDGETRYLRTGSGRDNTGYMFIEILCRSWQ